MIYYKHDDPNFTLTAYIEGEKEPIARKRSGKLRASCQQVVGNHFAQL